MSVLHTVSIRIQLGLPATSGLCRQHALHLHTLVRKRTSLVSLRIQLRCQRRWTSAGRMRCTYISWYASGVPHSVSIVRHERGWHGPDALGGQIGLVASASQPLEKCHVMSGGGSLLVQGTMFLPSLLLILSVACHGPPRNELGIPCMCLLLLLMLHFGLV